MCRRLEKYSWRDQERILNDSLPQFRTAIALPSLETPLRIHFIHIRSPHANAIPLLLIPPFPFTNLSLGHVTKAFTSPEDGGASHQPFHLVIPSLPGLGFSDPLPNNAPAISTAADLLDALMARLSYPTYLATNAGAASPSPAGIDWRLIDSLATRHAATCLGAHLISPPLAPPRPRDAPWEWAKWSVANFFHAGILGYSDDDFAALRRAYMSSPSPSSSSPTPTSASSAARQAARPSAGPGGLASGLGLGLLLRDPNALAYALCDSPTGLLVCVMLGLRALGASPSQRRASLSREQVVTLAELAWLPGPEYAMRFWARCEAGRGGGGDDGAEEEAAGKGKGRGKRGTSDARPRVAITVFLGGEDADEAGGGGGLAGAEGDDDEVDVLPELKQGEDVRDRYVFPTWGNARYDVVYTQRVKGRPGLLAWERPEVIAAGVAGLAKEVLRLDKRLEPAVTETDTVPLQRVVVQAENIGKGQGPLTKGKELARQQEGGPAEPSRRRSVTRPEGSGKGKGKEVETPRRPLAERQGPDTLPVLTSPL